MARSFCVGRRQTSSPGDNPSAGWLQRWQHNGISWDFICGFGIIFSPQDVYQNDQVGTSPSPPPHWIELLASPLPGRSWCCSPATPQLPRSGPAPCRRFQPQALTAPQSPHSSSHYPPRLWSSDHPSHMPRANSPPSVGGLSPNPHYLFGASAIPVPPVLPLLSLLMCPQQAWWTGTTSGTVGTDGREAPRTSSGEGGL